VHSIALSEYPRSWRWDLNGQDLYGQHFRDEGFREIPGADLLPGDSVLFSIRSTVANHAAVYLGGGKILHHLATSKQGYDPTRLSTVDDLSLFGDIPKKVLRHEKNSIVRTVGQKVWRNN